MRTEQELKPLFRKPESGNSHYNQFPKRIFPKQIQISKETKDQTTLKINILQFKIVNKKDVNNSTSLIKRGIETCILFDITN